jgi:hypothetical protein
VLKVQDSALFTIGAFFPGGNFAILSSGVDPGGARYAAAGALGIDPGTLVDIDCDNNGWQLPQGWCPLDQNDNGNGGSGATASNVFKGSFSANIDPNTGRGNFVNVSYQADPNGYCAGTLQSPSCGFSYYIINRQEMIMFSSDPLSKPANMVLITAERQPSSANGWTTASIGANNIMELSANDGGKADVTAGLITSDGAGNGTFAADENDGGTLTNTTAQPGTLSIGTTGNKTGQVILGFPQFGAGGAVMYLYGSKNGNPAFVVGTDAKATAGVMEPQQGSPFSISSVNGNYEGGTVSPAIAAVVNSVTYLHTDGIGNAFGSQYTSGPGGANGPNALNLTYTIDSTGRGVLTDTSTQSQFGFLYVVSPSKFVMVPTGDNPALNVLAFGQPD